MTMDFLYGILLLSMIPVRYEPEERSEMVTQLLFGDTFQIIEKEGSWLHIRNDYDGYEGWVSRSTVALLDEKTYLALQNAPKAIVTSYNAIVTAEQQVPQHIVMGSVLPNYDERTQTFSVGKQTFHLEGEAVFSSKIEQEKMVNYAKKFLKTPYLWGGKSPYGIDCSGFTQQVAKISGIKILRDASQQVKQGKEVGFLSEVLPGDLAFFDNEEGRIIHVGILRGDGRIIHASGEVRIDSIDQEGIYNLKLKTYTHRLRIIKRIKE